MSKNGEKRSEIAIVTTQLTHVAILVVDLQAVASVAGVWELVHVVELCAPHDT